MKAKGLREWQNKPENGRKSLQNVLSGTRLASKINKEILKIRLTDTEDNLVIVRGDGVWGAGRKMCRDKEV